MQRLILLFAFIAISFTTFLLKGEQKYSTKEFTILPPSPEVAALKSNADFSISHFTGQPLIDLPIYEIKEGSLSVPISIKYRGGGIKVMEVPGIIGLGWSLMASATISRTVCGMPDEISLNNLKGLFNITPNDRYLRKFVMEKPDDYTYIWADNKYCLEISKYCQNYEEWKADMANDILTIAGMGLNGVFAYNENKAIVLQTPNDIQFIDSGPAYPLVYSLADGKGTEYTFGESEISNYEYIYYHDRDKDFTTAKQNAKYLSAWHLTKLKSLQGDEILFEYKELGYRRYLVDAYESFDGVEPTGNTNIGGRLRGYSGKDIEVDYYPKALSKIRTKSEIIEFVYDSIQISSAKGAMYDQLKRILVKRNDAAQTIIKTFEFSHIESPFKKKKSYQLAKVVECGSDGKKKLPLYSFSYNNTSYNNNFRSQDHWGYYNGIDNSSLLPPYTGSSYIHYPSGDRSINRGNTQLGILNAITFPTGGVTTFGWEQHDYSSINSRELPKEIHTEKKSNEIKLWGIAKYEKLSVTGIRPCDKQLIIDVTKYVHPLESTGWLSDAGNVWYDYNHEHSDAIHDFKYYPHVEVSDPTTKKIIKRIYIDRNNSRKPVYVSGGSGTYDIRLVNHLNMHEGLVGFFTKEETRAYGYITIQYNTEITETTDNIRQWGGVRIKYISSSANDGTGNSITKRYSYVNNYFNPTSSSGVVPCEPSYEFQYMFGGPLDTGMGDDYEPVHGSTSKGLPRTILGEPCIQYYRVFETIDNGNDEMLIEYNYDTYKNYPDYLNMGFPGCAPAGSKIYTSFARYQGNLRSVKYQRTNRSSNYVKEISYHYDIYNGAYIQLTGDFVTIGEFGNFSLHSASNNPWKDYTVSVYDLVPYNKVLIETETKEISEDVIEGTKREQYFYFTDTYTQSPFSKFLSYQTTTDSQGRAKTTYYTYYKGRYKFPETEVTTVDDVIISSKLNVYDDKGHVIETYVGPAGIPITDKYELGKNYAANDALKEMINIPEFSYIYNNDGNIVQISYKGTVLASYLWGYKGKYPVVEALCMDYATLSAKAHSLGMPPESLSECYDNSRLSSFFISLRTSCAGYDISTLTYHWLIGTASSTDSSGITTYFSFDDFGRLSAEKDFNQHFIKKYEYNYR